jgi:catechol 2,3-dioxygenase-like lactoylglutathione lyase family enzyme
MGFSMHAFTLVVPSYDEGIAFYVGTMGFTLTADTDLGNAKRWVLVTTGGAGGCSILLARATDEAQVAAVGNQTGGRVGFFLKTDDFDSDYANMKAAGVTFEEEPRDMPYAKVVVWRDPFGNRWDMLQSKK